MGMRKADASEARRTRRAVEQDGEEAVPDIAQAAEVVASDATKGSERKQKGKRRLEAAAESGDTMEKPPEGTSAPEGAKRQKKSAQQPNQGATGVDDNTSSLDMSASQFREKMQIRSCGDADLPEPVQRIEAAPFPKKLRNALINAGFTAPTAIQAQGWPVAVQGSDLIAVAKTGSGKTLAYLLPAFRRLLKEQLDCTVGPALLVLAPTRELGVQIGAEAERFGQAASIVSQTVYGGAPKHAQVKALRLKPQVLVATPGRLVDLMTDKAVALSSSAILVLDEADRMLDMGFEPQMDQIMQQVPKERQTLLFSATWPKSVQKLAKKYLKDSAIHVNVGETEELAANKAVSQEFHPLDDDEKEGKLWKIMDAMSQTDKMIVFANTKRRCEKLSKDVLASGYDCVAMHGDKAQWERDAGLAKFVSGKAQVMFATDVCARGLDIKGVTHVVNFDMARDVESYIHRIGRTGRAGASGVSITFFNDAYDMECAPALAKIAREAGQEVPSFLEKAANKTANKGKNKLWKY